MPTKESTADLHRIRDRLHRELDEIKDDEHALAARWRTSKLKRLEQVEKDLMRTNTETLKAELEQIDADLRALDQQTREAEQGIEINALPAMRGDAKAKKKLAGHEESRASAADQRRRLEAARKGVCAELEAIASAERADAERQRVAEIATHVSGLKERAREADAAAKVFRLSIDGLMAELNLLRENGRKGPSAEMTRHTIERAWAVVAAGSPLASLRGAVSDKSFTFAKLAEGWAAMFTAPTVAPNPAPMEIPADALIDDDRTVVTIKPAMPRSA